MEGSSQLQPNVLTPEEAEALLEENTATLVSHFQEVGYGVESYHPLEDLARKVAMWFGGASTSRIVDAKSELQEGGGNILTLTDEEGNTFILPLGSNGSLGIIKDSEGNIVVRVVE